MKSGIFSGYWGKLHCQGIAVDPQKGFLYYSFTDKLVKCDMNGEVIGTVDHIIGHLGCIDFNDADGKIYASLEYKNDAIGRGILKTLGQEGKRLKNGFYIAIFDVDKIDRLDMDAEADGVMRAVYLKTVVDDFEGKVEIDGRIYPHVHGCSGIDGVTIGPDFGSTEKRTYLHVCYGVYSDTDRKDNDYQIILQYEIEEWWERVARPLLQADMHENGPAYPRRKYFAYTGNTCYGVQNLEYDAYSGDYFLCVYPGKKEQFPNYPMYVIDGHIAAIEESLNGYPKGATGAVLSLKDTGLCEKGIYGIDFPHGSTGFYSFGDGTFLVSEPVRSECKGQATNLCYYRLCKNDARWTFVPV